MLKNEHESFKVQFADLALRIGAMEKAIKSSYKRRSSDSIDGDSTLKDHASTSHMESDLTNAEIATPKLSPQPVKSKLI